MSRIKVNSAAELALGVTKEQIDEMQTAINQLERQNDAIGLTRVRHAVNQRLVEIRLLLRDGHLKNLNGGIDMRADLADYYDPMDPGFPDRGSEADVDRYLESRKAKGLLNPTASHKLIAQLQARTTDTPKAAGPHEYLLVSDKTSEVLKSDSDCMCIKKLAGIVRKAGGEVTIFKDIKG